MAPLFPYSKKNPNSGYYFQTVVVVFFLPLVKRGGIFSPIFDSARIAQSFLVSYFPKFWQKYHPDFGQEYKPIVLHRIAVFELKRKEHPMHSFF